MKRLAQRGVLYIIIVAMPTLAQAMTDLVIATTVPPNSMNPHSFSSDANLSYMANFFDGLLQRKGPEGKLLPSLATAWKRLDALTWKFTLRRGVKFHNGNDFDAEDVKFSFTRLKDPKYSQLLNIANAIESIETPDKYTVIFKTREPVPWFAETMHQNFIVDKESSETREDDDYNSRPIGTGAYKFIEWVKGSHIRMEANDQYWEGPPKYKIVDIRQISEELALFAALVGKEVDIAFGVPATLWDYLRTLPYIRLISQAGRRVIYMDIGNRPGTPFADIRVRQAIAHAINEQEIIDTIMHGQATLAHQIPDILTLGYDASIQRLPYDPAKAKKLLAAAGYPDGFEITIAGPNDQYVNDEKICAAVAEYLTKIGLKVKLDIKETSIFFDELTGKKHSFYLIGWSDGSFDFGHSADRLLHTPDDAKGLGIYNVAFYSNSGLDRQIVASSAILDRSKRERTLQQINRQSIEDVAWIPLHYQQDIFALLKDKGIAFVPRRDQWIVVKEIK